MAITREELKKLVLQEMQQNQVDEGVGDWLRSKASSMLTKTGQKMTQAGEKVAPPPQLDDKTLRKVGDFLQMAQRDPELTKLILQTPFGKTVFGSDEKEKVTEALGQDFIKMIKDKKVTPQMLTGFIDAMKANPKAQKMMTGLGLIPKDSKPAQSTAEKPAEEPVAQQTQTGDVPVSDSDIVATEPAAQQKNVPDLVSGIEVKTKKANIKFLAPVEDAPSAETAKEIAKTNADRAALLKQKFDSGKATASEKDELLALMGFGKQKTTKAKSKKQSVKKAATSSLQKGMMTAGGRLGESLQEAIIEEIYNLLTGKTK